MSAGALGSFLLSAGFAIMVPLVLHSSRVSQHTSSVLINVAGTGKAAQSSTRFAQEDRKLVMSVPLSNRGSHNAQFAIDGVNNGCILVHTTVQIFHRLRSDNSRSRSMAARRGKCPSQSPCCLPRLDHRRRNSELRLDPT